ncbi:MAG TPA: AraC family transcriptional regulator [Pyrinomonadaceae bacterium]|nr:AraC family transcriptional regulator [Pyrinomonadaceae bacterium]
MSLNRNLQPGHFYGEITRKREASGLILSELKHETARKLPSHSHELAYFCLLLNGNYWEQFGRKRITYKPLTVMFHPPGMTHVDEIGPAGGRFFNVEVKTELMDRLRECLGRVDLDSSLHAGDLAWLAMRLYREHKEADACSVLTIEGLVLEMLALVGRLKDSKLRDQPRWLSNAVDLLHAEFRSNLKVQDIANEIGVHPFHLSRVFRTVHRQTIGEYVHKLRVAYACKMLALPDCDLATVALSAGFADQSHFTKVFKNLTGMTPGAFRQISTDTKL